MSRTLSQVLALLEHIAPLELAEAWDNVGLLVEPSRAATQDFERLLLCIDFNESVLAEALDARADFVIAYHPPIFRGLTRLRGSSSEERVLVRALEAGLAVYSPHSALDATPGGVNDWLARGVGKGPSVPIVPNALRPEAGAGRRLQLDTPATLGAIVDRLKTHLGVAVLRVARPDAETAISRVALCAGAGGSSFEAVRGVDLFVTGEMRHHDVLAKVRSGASVILAEHSHTERGFLPELAERIRELSKHQLAVLVSTRDADPLSTV